MEAKTYQNLNELLEAHGAETPYRFGRSLYKYTDCGPWTVFILEDAAAKDEVQDIVIACDPKTQKATLESGSLDEDLKMVLCLDDDPVASKWSWKKYCAELDKFIKKHPDVPGGKMSITKKSIARRWIRVERRIPAKTEEVYYEDNKEFDLSRCVGIKVGSIVEGSDVEVGPETLMFPFTEEQFDKTVEGINDECSFYWERDNSKWYCVRDKGGDSFPFQETWGEVKWESETPPARVKKAAEKWANAGGRWQKEDPKSPNCTMESFEMEDWVPLPGAKGWEVTEYYNDGIY